MRRHIAAPHYNLLSAKKNVYHAHMHSAQGQIIQTAFDEERAARLQCPPALIPAPGQYLLTHAPGDAHHPLPVVLYPSALHPDGFTAAGPLPPHWTPGLRLYLRGPLGHGFSLPPAARALGLIAVQTSPARLLPLIQPALNQGAAVALSTARIPEGLPPAVEIVPPHAAPEIAAWADCLCLDIPRPLLPNLPHLLGNAPLPTAAQALVQTPIPCGNLGECSVCAVPLRHGWALACKEGPVFALKALLK